LRSISYPVIAGLTVKIIIDSNAKIAVKKNVGCKCRKYSIVEKKQAAPCEAACIQNVLKL